MNTSNHERSESEPKSREESTIEELEHELRVTREHLQTIIEEHETANEELQALNEELNSANEEMQSTNEELETANEELQSTNEELTTLNEELNSKSDELIDLNQYLEQIQDAMDYPLFMVDQNMNLRRFNRAASRIFSVAEKDVGRNVRLLTGPYKLSSAFNAIEEAIKTQMQVVSEFENEMVSFRIQADPVTNSKGSLEGAVVSFIDNTRIMRALHDAEAKENRLRAVLNNTPSIVSVKDSVGRFTFVNPGFCEFVGIKEPDKILGKTDEDIFSPETSRRIRATDFEVLRDRKPIKITEDLEINGRHRYFLSSKFPLFDNPKTAHSTCTISLDMTEVVESSQKLEMFKHAMASSHEGFIIFKVKGESYEAIYGNEAFENIVGVKNEQLMGTSILNVLNLIAEKDPHLDIKKIKEGIKRDQIHQLELKIHKPNGDLRWLDLRFSHLRNEAGQLTYAFVLALDITPRKVAEEKVREHQDELVKTSKLLALGEMAAGIAHEINTPLNSIQGYVDLLEQLVERDKLKSEDVLKAAKKIESTVHTIADVISGLKSIAKMDTEGREVDRDLRKIIQDALILCEYHLRNKQVALETEIPDVEMPVHCNPIQIGQVLINLVNNAVDAIKSLPVKWVRIKASNEGNHFVIRVIDSGSGIPKQLAEKIMTPFFTTKQEGTGLGLSLSQSIVKKYGGVIRLNHDMEHTCFEVLLPKVSH